MDKIAFVFSGQGAQYSGMGKTLYELGGAAKKLYDSSEEIRKGTIEQSFSGSDEELKLTVNTQPCLYLVDLAAALSLNEAGIFADGVAGFSLGEIAALAYSGAYSYTDGFKIVTERSKLMQKAGEASEETAMCAVMKLDAKTVADTAAEYEKLYAVNFNCPGQTVVSGLKSSIAEFEEKIKELGGRCIPLAVSASFHSPFMNDASEEFAKILNNFDISLPKIPTYANYTALTYNENPVEMLTLQMRSPVRWQETIENMIKDNYNIFIEVGAGKTLSGLIKKISKDVRVYNVEDAETLNACVKEIKENA